MQNDSVRIAQMRARGLPSADRISDVLRHLEEVHWPDSPELFLVRKLSVQTQLSGLARAVTAALQRAHVEATFVHCGQAAPSNATAVRFATPAVRVAALASDLAMGVGAEQWYWRIAAAELLPLPKSDALVRLLTQDVEHFAAVCSSLSQQAKLDNLWSALSDAACIEIEYALLSKFGFDTTPATDEDFDSASGAVASKVLSEMTFPESAVSKCRTYVADARRSAVLRLAGVATLLETAPLLLSHPLVSPRLVTQRLGQCVIQEISAPDSKEPAPPTAVPYTFTAELQQDEVDPRAAERNSIHRSQGGVANESPRATMVADSTSLKGDTGPVDKRSGAAMTVQPLDSGTLTQMPPSDRVEGEEFVTEYGGTVFLVNAMQHPRLRALFRELGLFHGRLHGWGWWLALAQDLGLPMDDAMTRWLRATNESLADPAPEPAAVERAAIHAAARDLYGAEMWNSALLKAAGSVATTPTHVFARFPLNSVRIDVRMAGLDLNPGWVNWLGRVIALQFHGVATSP